MGRIDESIKIFGIAHVAFPNCVSLKIFEILTLHAQGKHNTAVANALNLLADNIQTNEVKRYETAMRANAKHLLNTEQ